MAEAPRRRRKAVDGLDKLPTTEQEWYGMALTYHLANAKLQDLCSYGRFSASTVPKEAFLTVRCIWPGVMAANDALPYIYRTGSFFNGEHIAHAERLINRGLLGLDKLNTLFDIICSEAKTPREWLCTVADGLGPFSLLITLHRQIMDNYLHAAPKEESKPVTYAPRKQGHYDASQPSSGPQAFPDSPTPRRPKRPRRGFSVPMDEDDLQGTNSPSSQLETELLEITDELPDEIPEPRTPTETLVVDFMVNFIGGIACLLQRLTSYTVCVANAFETTYRFGPVRKDPTPADEIQFRARIDGSIPFSSPSDRSLPEMVMFEAKRTPRGPGQGATVMGQQSMEHVAYVWKRHEKQTPISPGVYHTFMIAQDYLSFYITIGTYGKEYLDYIFGPGDVPVIPLSSRSKAFLQIQEFGPFHVDERAHMKLLLHIILCLMIWQLDGKKEGLMIKEALA
ncbi:hypothetical protein AJ79_09319 [Helicocarpus griseus UAMH5409]|uniref:Uncharacterized protein n=1 Tax=Helicocarpus griseus UAMH5409 TaxID=1447875 RepID=A0A2B7WKN1_9EURO|nr:hypothetical protein AJ79_09319 [Helicocarpus griseus UAMH5409]